MNKSNKHAYLVFLVITIFTQSSVIRLQSTVIMKLTYSLECILIIPVIISISGLILLESKSTLEHIVEKADILLG